MEMSHRPRPFYHWWKFRCGCWTGCCVDLTALLDVSEKYKFVHPVGIGCVCRQKCSALVYFCLPDTFNCICGTDWRFVMSVNSGEIGVHIFRIKNYCIPKYFKIVTLKAQRLLYLPSHTTSLRVCGSISLLHLHVSLTWVRRNLPVFHKV